MYTMVSYSYLTLLYYRQRAKTTIVVLHSWLSFSFRFSHRFSRTHIYQWFSFSFVTLHSLLACCHGFLSFACSLFLYVSQYNNAEWFVYILYIRIPAFHSTILSLFSLSFSLCLSHCYSFHFAFYIEFNDCALLTHKHIHRLVLRLVELNVSVCMCSCIVVYLYSVALSR